MLVSRFRSSHHCAAHSFANFGIKGTLAIYDSSAVFGFEVPTQTRGYNDRNFKSTALVQTRLHEVAENGFFAELLAGFQPVEAFHQHEPVAIPPYHDRGLLAVLQNALGDLPRLGDVERGAPFRRHIDFRNRECLALHHGGFVPLRSSCLVTSFPLPAKLRFAKRPARPMRRRAFAVCKADALTAPMDRVATGSARPWATCLCR